MTGRQMTTEWVRPAYGWSSALVVRRNRRVFGFIGESECSGLGKSYEMGRHRMGLGPYSVKVNSTNIGAEYGEVC